MSPSNKKNSEERKKELLKKYEEQRKQHTLIGKIKKKFEKRKKTKPDKKGKFDIGEKEIPKEKKEKTKEEKQETKFYWSRAGTGIITALFGTLVFNLVGWAMLGFMLAFLLGFPFVISFLILRLPYKKKVWDWKKIISKGISPHFFLFLLISTIAHTYIVTGMYQERFDNPASTNGIHLEGSLLYVADGSNGFLILNTTNNGAGHRILLNNHKPNGTMNVIAVHDNIAYLINDQEGLLLYNITDIDNIEILSSNSSFKEATSLTINNDILFISNGNNGLELFDISTPSSPSWLSNYVVNEGYIYSVSIIGNNAFLSSGKQGIQIIDISTPTNPTKVYEFISSNDVNISKTLIIDNVCYAAHNGFGLEIYDINDLNNIELTEAFNLTVNKTYDIFRDLIQYQDNILLGAGEFGIYLYNKSANTLESLYNPLGPIRDLELSGDFLLISEEWRGLTVIDLTNVPPNPDPVSSAAKKIDFGWTWAIISIITLPLIVIYTRNKIKKI